MWLKYFVLKTISLHKDNEAIWRAVSDKEYEETDN